VKAVSSNPSTTKKKKKEEEEEEVELSEHQETEIRRLEL
jgi:hypothetical protein